MEYPNEEDACQRGGGGRLGGLGRLGCCGVGYALARPGRQQRRALAVGAATTCRCSGGTREGCGSRSARGSGSGGARRPAGHRVATGARQATTSVDRVVLDRGGTVGTAKFAGVGSTALKKAVSA